MNAVSEIIRAKIVVRGVVQGVGFRPFIHHLASEHQLAGWVLNSTEGVVIEVEGDCLSVQGFIADIPAKSPPLAVVERVETSFLPPVGYKSFIIQASQELEGKFALISPDICICADCLREVFNPGDRRFRYPFTNCTNCGPRFTIIRDIPYDRPRTTMSVFPMCPDCEREYHDPTNRRFHAQPNACPVCGPGVWLARDGEAVARDAQAIQETRRLLAEGKVVTIKGIGGFHLACDATSDRAVELLRRRKRRVEKPFAIMSLDSSAVESYCELREGERQLLESPQRPIVLLRRKPGSPISSLVAPGNATLGVMLPYTPLHYLIMEPGDDMPIALVMTSGNMSEEPIAMGNEEALERLAPLADAFLLHNRDIHMRYDDSVTRLFEGKEAVLRRSRGYAPFPVRLDFQMKQILACGGELKNTFCLTRENYAFLSPHIGDLENLETLDSFESGIEHFKRLFRISPEAVAYDLHPEYLSTSYALQLQAANPHLRLVPVQHHHAHMASCMAENGLNQRVIGVSFDGTGYGDDGAIWGGEFLVGDYRGYQRQAHLKYVPLPGGDIAIKRPYRMALSHLLSAFGTLEVCPSLMERLSPREVDIILRQVRTGMNSVSTSSMGRLFDAVSSLLRVRDAVSYEGQAAIELEMLASENIEDSYPWQISDGMPIIIDPAPLFRAILDDMRAGAGVPVISARFHNSVAELVARVCGMIRERQALNCAVLSGGVFQNMYLLGRALRRLRENGFQTYIHHQVPANDGGISLGQALVANAILAAEEKESTGYVSSRAR